MANLTWVATAATADPTVSTNWKTSTGSNATPATGDTLNFTGAGTANVQAIDQSAVINITLNVTRSNAAQAGTDTGGVAAAWKIGTTTINYGVADNSSGAGATHFFLDAGTNACTLNCFSANSSSLNGNRYPSLDVIGTALKFEVSGGTCGSATRPGFTSTITEVNVKAGGVVTLGPGVTLTTVTNNGGTLTTNSGITTLNQLAGTTNAYGLTKVTTINAYGGTLNYAIRPASGNIVDTLNLLGANINFSADPRTGTVGTTAATLGSITMFSSSQITFTTLTLSVAGFTKLNFSASN